MEQSFTSSLFVFVCVFVCQQVELALKVQLDYGQDNLQLAPGGRSHPNICVDGKQLLQQTFKN